MVITDGKCPESEVRQNEVIGGEMEVHQRCMWKLLGEIRQRETKIGVRQQKLNRAFWKPINNAGFRYLDLIIAPRLSLALIKLDCSLPVATVLPQLSSTRENVLIKPRTHDFFTAKRVFIFFLLPLALCHKTLSWDPRLIDDWRFTRTSIEFITAHVPSTLFWLSPRLWISSYIYLMSAYDLDILYS